MFFATDIGVNGCLLTKRGGKWCCCYTPLDTDVSAPTLNSTTETILAQGIIPAGLFRDGAKLHAFDKSTKPTTTDTLNRRLRLGSAGTTADGLVFTNTYGAANISNYSLQSIARRNNTTQARLTSGAIGPYGSATGATADYTSSDTDSQFYFTLTGQMSGVTDTYTFNFLEIGLELP